MDRSAVIGRIRRECGEWALEAVTRHVRSSRSDRAIVEGIIRAEDDLELAVPQSDARVRAREALRDIRRPLERAAFG